MEIRSKFLAVVIAIILSLLSAFLGAGAGLFLYGNLIPPWKHYQISSLPGATDILQIDIHASLTDPAEDVLYVTAEHKQLFSNTLFQKDWHLVESVPENDYEFPLCATEWKDHPPVSAGIIDSAGVRFERPLSTIVRCYVLFKDGSLQVWTRSTDVFSLMTIVSVGGLLGFILGMTIGVSVWRKLRLPSLNRL
jgi:hypothetical protein